MDISLLANKARHLFQGHKSTASNAYFIKTLPNRNMLKKFGGKMDIKEYRDGCMKLNGEIIGTDRTNPMGLCRKEQRKNIKPTAFIDETLVKIVRVTVNSNGSLQTVGHNNPHNHTADKKRTFQNSEQLITQKMQESKQRKIQKQSKNMFTLDKMMHLEVKNETK
jgi:hypothetical protein